jgi:copper(I)-binding protein
MTVRNAALAALAAAILATPAAAEQITKGDIVITDPWARATPKGAAVAGGFMQIENKGSAPDKLTGGTLPLAGRFEVHEMTMTGEVMKMRPVEGGLAIPPGGSVVLKPGSYHVMFMELKEPLVEGTTLTGTLTFEKAGTVEVHYAVRALGATGQRAPNAPANHKGH